jgi:hypothetical protein
MIRLIETINDLQCMVYSVKYPKGHLCKVWKDCRKQCPLTYGGRFHDNTKNTNNNDVIILDVD